MKFRNLSKREQDFLLSQNSVDILSERIRENQKKVREIADLANRLKAALDALER